MKILILTNFDMGLYKFRKELMTELCKKNEVIAALPDGEYIEQLKGLGLKYINFEFKRRGMNPFADLHQFFRYIRLIKRVQPDVVLTYTIKPNVYGGLACRVLKMPYIANVTGLGASIENGGVLSKISGTLYKMGLKGAKCVFFQNSNNQKLFEKCNLKKSRLIPGSGVNLEVHPLEAYPADDEGIKFLFVGRVMRTKGMNELLEAMEKLYGRHKNVLLDIVGFCEEDYEESLDKAEKKGFVKYHGAQEDVHTFMKKAHCIVIPSYFEGLSNVILESSSTGRPVIATRIPGCVEAFDEGVTGFGCDLKSTESLLDAMEKFMSLSNDERRQMGLNGRKKIESEFDRNVVIKAYLEEIETV